MNEKGPGQEPGRLAETKLQRSSRLLITAALANGPDALQAWQLWLTEFELDTLKGDSYWILPLLSRNLARSGGRYQEQQRLAGVYKQMRLRNTILQTPIKDLIGKLHDQDCDVLSGAITSLVLGGEDAIPLDPAELLVPVGSLEAADSVIQSCGWEARLPLPPRLLRPFVTSVRYCQEKAGELILSWRPFGLDCPLDQDSSLWQRAGPGQSGTLAIRMADPVDCLLMAMQKGSYLQVSVLLNRWSPKISNQALRDRAAELGLAELLPGLTEIAELRMPAVVRFAPTPAQHTFNFTGPPDASASLLTLSRRQWRRYCRCPVPYRPASFITYIRDYYRYNWQTPTPFRFIAKALNRTGSRFSQGGK